ncbi:hypothetical protein MHI24_16955 [Paenibacillus sp. FSL K6-1096]|uniref:hypothetical protein n=1 Tax=Paenibacillus sp. FSL K6-1096 TaxID=2921460 RepID=UPI0030ED6F99
MEQHQALVDELTGPGCRFQAACVRMEGTTIRRRRIQRLTLPQEGVHSIHEAQFIRQPGGGCRDAFAA